MALTVDLNADLGESFGEWRLGDDAALLDVLTSANIACGFHAGDPDVMAETMAKATARGVGIGAHPGFPDLQGFGRRNMDISHKTLGNMVAYQLGAAQAMARKVGGHIRHLKLHGALANMASRNQDLALACYTAALAVDPDIRIIVIARTAQQRAVETLKCAFAAEIFADRTYLDDATLMPRSQSGAVIHDPKNAANRIVEMVTSGEIIAQSGKRIPARIDTICLHSDTAGAVAIAHAVRAALAAADIAINRF